jgi:4-hydroxythreonine-4-phosphate dehydrogenase
MNIANCIALTAGDINSIAPLITLKAWLKLRNTPYSFVVIGHSQYLDKLIKHFSLPIQTCVVDNIEDIPNIFNKYLPVINIAQEYEWNIGVRSTANSLFTLSSIDLAIDYALNKKVFAIVSNPIDKELIAQGLGNKNFKGHTGYLGEKTHSKPIMMLCSTSSKTKVIPLTTHIPLKDIFSVLNESFIIESIKNIAENLSKNGFHNMSLAVCGLNPHAGDNGLMGHEEQEFIIPALAKLQSMGINCYGPFSADTLFIQNSLEQYDVVIGMYHDQVLAPFKALHFDDGVNCTLGLPFIRTSPDHGTAFSMANNIDTSENSLVSAIIMAYNLHKNQLK